jgi:hypothetical protein
MAVAINFRLPIKLKETCRETAPRSICPGIAGASHRHLAIGAAIHGYGDHDTVRWQDGAIRTNKRPLASVREDLMTRIAARTDRARLGRQVAETARIT